jgi:phosphatidylglycerophosphate synthase
MEWSKEVYEAIKYPVKSFCLQHKITADQITYFNHFLTLSLGCFLFSRGTYISGLLALAVMLINGYLDYLDGDLAKSTNTQSKFGEWIDSGFDVVIQNAVLGAIALGCVKQGMPLIWIVLFFISNIGNNLVSFYYNKTFGFDSANGNSLFRAFMNIKKSQLNIFFKNLIDPTSSMAGLILFTYRYFIVIGFILNQMPYFFIVMTMISSVKWFIMFILYGLHLKREKRLFILQALAMLDDEREERYALYNS